MPTGYTAKILEDATFEEYIMGCAKAFGACISLRDSPSSEPIPEQFKESTHHMEKYNEYVAEMDKVVNMSVAEADIEAEKEYTQEIEGRDENLNKAIEQSKKYGDMLAQVKLWEPPTPEHENLKTFMIDQIKLSDGEWEVEYYSKQKIIQLNGEQWLYNRVEGIKKDIKYHMEKWQEETKNIATKNLWIKQLRDSLLKEKK